MLKEDKKIFEDYIDQVDCNNCSQYWNDLCNGVKISQKRHCNSFVARRGINIPKEIEKLSKGLNQAKNAILILSLILGLITGAALILIFNLTGGLL